MKTVELSAPPPLAGLYARAAAGLVTARLGRGGSSRTLPDVEHVLPAVPVTADRLTAYQHLVGEPASDVLPAGFVHVLTFPVVLSVMARPDFPLPMVGMVHLANRVEQQRAVLLGEPLKIRSWSQDMRPHAKGTQVDLCAEVRTADDEMLWSGTSTYLAKGVRTGGGTPDEARPPDGAAVTAPSVDAASHGSAGTTGSPGPEAAGIPGGPPTGIWRLPADTGRRYAAVSGDRNPIHLSALAARAFGFRRTVAHGMYTAARALAAMAPVGGRIAWDVHFGSPVLLPATLHLRVEDDGTGRASRLWDPRTGREHLSSAVHPL